MKTLNPYTIHWAILTSDKGVIRKNDVETIDGYSFHSRQKVACIHAPSKEKLMEKLNAAKGKLEKSYNVLIITDAQFGKMDMQSNGFDHQKAAMQVATSMQKDDQFAIA